MKFEKEYFNSVNYTDYLERENRYKKLAKELIQYCVDKKIIDKQSKLLDYGCAVGFLVSWIRHHGYFCEGFDISEWAGNECKKRNIIYIKLESQKFNVLFSLDVFEHMLDDDIKNVLELFTPDYIFVRIPCSEDDTKMFYLNISRKDLTHINCKNRSEWTDFFKKNGYIEYDTLDLYTIYDSKGVMCKVFKKL